MRSQLVERLGAQEPTIQHRPPDVASLAAGEEAIELADAYGVASGQPLAESQRITLRYAMAERADGSWAASRVADFGPRQGTGKNDKIAARELAGLVLLGEQLIIHTAHEFPTANESFLRLVSVFENWDDLRRKVSRIRYANGEQGIELLTGQRLKYRARTGGSGRGFAGADLIVYDEAQHLAREHVAASGPAKLANRNSQTWYAGSGGLETSMVAWGLRKAALAGTGGRLAYTEMTAESVRLIDGRPVSTRPDPSDRATWYAAMPGLGRWVTEESMAALYEELGPDLFARECLCVWEPEPDSADPIFPPGSWRSVCGPDFAPDGSVVLGVDTNPERTRTAILAADPGGSVELVDYRAGTGWVAGRVAELQGRWACPVAVDSAGPAKSLLPDLEAAGVAVSKVTEMPSACAAFYDRVVEGRLQVRTSPDLDAAVVGAVRRLSGDVWRWDRRSAAVDISPLVAATVACWVASQPVKEFVAGFVSLADV
jgi:hypothetical protein